MKTLFVLALSLGAPSLNAQSAPGVEFVRRHGCAKVGKDFLRPMVGMTACEVIAAAGVPAGAYEVALQDSTTTALLVYWKDNVRYVASLLQPHQERADLTVTATWWPACFADSSRRAPAECPPAARP